MVCLCVYVCMYVCTCVYLFTLNILNLFLFLFFLLILDRLIGKHMCLYIYIYIYYILKYYSVLITCAGLTAPTSLCSHHPNNHHHIHNNNISYITSWPLLPVTPGKLVSLRIHGNTNTGTHQRCSLHSRCGKHTPT